MSALSTIEMRPFPVRTALVVHGDPPIETRLREILGPDGWAIQRARQRDRASPGSKEQFRSDFD
jgi:hypothetical protein